MDYTNNIKSLGYIIIAGIPDNHLSELTIKDRDGYIFLLTVASILNTQKHHPFSISNPYTIQNINNWVKTNNKTFELITDKYEGNQLKMLWRCDICKDAFSATWNSILKGSGCSVCSGKQVGKSNNLCDCFPEISEDWDYDKNDITPDKCCKGSRYRANWKCHKCGNEWAAPVHERTRRNTKCPVCAGKIAGEFSNIKYLFPDLMIFWDYDKNKNTPDRYLPSSRKKVWWKCDVCNYEWNDYISNVTRNGNCPLCSNKQRKSKYVKITINECIKKFGEENVFLEYRILKNPQTLRFLPYDIYIKSINIFIELHGKQHYEETSLFHKSVEEFLYDKSLDFFKKKYAESVGTYIEIDLREIKNERDIIENINKKLKRWTQ